MPPITPQHYRRYLSIWLTHWATDCHARRRRRAKLDAAPSPETPLALSCRAANALEIAAVDPKAAALGIRPGQPLADVRAANPGLRIEPFDPAADAADLSCLADWATRFSPAVAVDGEDGLMLEITGCAHLWSGEAGLLADAKSRLAGFELHCRMAIADTIGAAWAMARFGPPGPIQPPGELAPALADLPPAALRLDQVLTAQLTRLGLRRIGDIAALPRASLAERFGPGLLLRLDQAHGQVAEALSPLTPRPARYVRLDLAEPIMDQPSVLRAIEAPLSRLVELLRSEELGIRRLELACYLLNGETRRVAIGTATPSLDIAHLQSLLAERLETLDCGDGIEALRLEANLVDPLERRQSSLDEPIRDPASLSPLIDRLDNRLGRPAAHRPVPRESHIPERAVARLPPLAPPIRHHWPKAAHRPLRLLAHPEPIIVVAPVPDDPPLQFRWRRRLHRVRAAEGPERIAPEWWLSKDDGAEPRDYYRIEDSEGRRFWLYRAGLYRADRPARWFLHGLFG